METIDGFIENKVDEAILIFDNLIYRAEDSIFCSIHDLMRDSDFDHNCIGCNLDESSAMISSTLNLANNYPSNKLKCEIIIIVLYLLVEKIDSVLNIIQIHDGYRKENFKNLNRVRKWANFVKHPKAFMFSHHPIFSIEGYSGNSELLKASKVTINNSFLYKYYSNDLKNLELHKKLENKEDVLVIYPCPAKLVEGIANECNLFTTMLKNNEVYRQVLKSRSTFLGFWEEE